MDTCEYICLDSRLFIDIQWGNRLAAVGHVVRLYIPKCIDLYQLIVQNRTEQDRELGQQLKGNMQSRCLPAAFVKLKVASTLDPL